MGNHPPTRETLCNRSQGHQITDFIIQHLGNNPLQIQTSDFDIRRLVFVSLDGLYRSWHRVPSMLLYTSLLLMPLKQKWLYQPTKLAQQLEQINLDPAELAEFVDLLRWKESQGLVIWILDELESDPNEYTLQIRTVSNPFVASFWHKLSAKLMLLHDHIENRRYDPLIFDEKYWNNAERFCSKYNTSTKTILSELYFVTMNAFAMQEIIYQSNPKTLRPIVEYEDNFHLYPISEEPEKKEFDDIMHG